VKAIAAESQAGLQPAADVAGYVDRLTAWLGDRAAADAAGQSARDFVVNAYSWDAHLAGLDRHLEAA